MVTLNKKESKRFLKRMLHEEQRPGRTNYEKRVTKAIKDQGFDWSAWDKELIDENKKLEQWMISNYGPRCPDFQKGCKVCEGWKLFDKLKMDI
jgi:hypothetical protein